LLLTVHCPQTPVVVIDGVFTRDLIALFVDEINDSKNAFKPSQVYSSDTRPIDSSARKSQTLVIAEPQSNFKQSNSAILSAFSGLFATPELWDKLPDPLPAISVCDYLEVAVNRYAEGDFFHWHSDAKVKHPNQRLITCIYFLAADNITGGELLVKGRNSVHALSPTENTLIIFPADRLHAVNKVGAADRSKSARRIAVTAWLGTP